MTPSASSGGDGALKARYNKHEANRLTYLNRACEASKYTIPSLVPPIGHTSNTKLPTPFQSFGARGVNNLAAKLLLSLLPANTPFFRLSVSDLMLQKITGRDGMRAAVEEALSSMERSVMVEIETSPIRTAFHEALKHLLVAGNVLVYMTPEKTGMKIFRLDRYVCKRDPMGNPLEIITKENISRLELSDEILAVLPEKDANESLEDTEELYTCIKRTRQGWDIWQEIRGVEVPGSRGDYPKDKCPWLALRYTAIDGEDYGRGFVEEYLGDLKSLEGLQRAIVEGSAAASKIIFLVKPNSTTQQRSLATAASGDIIAGNAEDVSVLQVEKAADFRIALETIKKLEEALAYAFLLNSAIQRNGDRVTAYEMRLMANELDSALGGIYSALSQEFQLPLLTNIMVQMEQQKKLPQLPKGAVKPLITTGIEAIGRGNDLTKLQDLLEALAPLGPEVIAQSLNVDDYIKRTGSSLGIDMKGLIYSAEEKAMKAQEAQQMQLIQQLGPNAINAMGGMAKQQMANEASAQPPAPPQ